MRSVYFFCAVAAVACLAGIGALGYGSSRAGAASDRALEASLLAPCCWNGTLSSHESELARQLRGEIETLYANGEPTRAIEADLARRYGERIRAMPNQGAFLFMTGLAGALGVVGFLFVLAIMRRGRRAALDDGRSVIPPLRDEYDERIDVELSHLE